MLKISRVDFLRKIRKCLSDCQLIQGELAYNRKYPVLA